MLAGIRIHDHELGLWFRHGNFFRLLEPGAYRIWSRLWRSRRDVVELVNTLKLSFTHPLLDVLVANEQVRRELVVVDLADAERALLWRDGRLAHILGPGRHAFWRKSHELRVERFNVSAFRFEHPDLEAILAHPEAAGRLEVLTSEPHEAVLLFRNGRLIETLAPGRHAFWRGAGHFTRESVDVRESVSEVAGQEIMTADKVALRINLLVGYQVTDPVLAITRVADHTQSLYREAQLVLRAAIGTRTLDALLANREAVGAEALQILSRRTEQFGVTIRGIGLRDIILPGEMRKILNRVLAAEKQAEANVIRRREETAATRSLANTARLLADNPLLARMKELEALQDLLTGMKATFVVGNSDLVRQVSGLIARTDASDAAPAGGA